jgi:hypothetical protein
LLRRAIKLENINASDVSIQVAEKVTLKGTKKQFMIRNEITNVVNVILPLTQNLT